MMKESPSAIAGFNNQAKHASAASDVMQQADALAERAQRLAEHVFSRLEAVSQPVEPTPEKQLDGLVQRHYPKLFSSLRSSLERADAALDHIEAAMSRVDL